MVLIEPCKVSAGIGTESYRRGWRERVRPKLNRVRGRDILVPVESVGVFWFKKLYIVVSADQKRDDLASVKL